LSNESLSSGFLRAASSTAEIVTAGIQTRGPVGVLLDQVPRILFPPDFRQTGPPAVVEDNLSIGAPYRHVATIARYGAKDGRVAIAIFGSVVGA